MKVTPDLLAALTPDSVDEDAWAPLLDGMALDLLANVLHETGRLTTLRESLNYSPAGLLRMFPTHFTPATAQALGRVPPRPANQWAIAEHAYGGRMGNAPAGHGDGWAFRGAGGLQTTGRDNMAAFAKAIRWQGILSDLPGYMATPAGAAESARAWWDTSGCASMTDPAAIRRRVNGGTNGLQEVLDLRAEITKGARA